MDLRHQLQLLRRHAWVITLAVLIAVAAAVTLQVRQVPMYEAEAAVLLRPENITQSGLDGSTGDLNEARYASIEIAVITSKAIAEGVAAELPGLDASEVQKAVTASVDEEAAIVTIAASSPDPRMAAAIADAVADVYVAQRTATETARISQAIAELDDRLAALDDRLAGLAGEPEDSPDLLAVRDQYTTIFGRQQDLLVQLSLQRPTAEVLAGAELPVSPTGLGAPSTIVLAALLGGVVGLGLAYAREELDDRVRSREEVQQIAGVPVLVELPLDRKSGRAPAHIATAGEPLGRFAEAIRSLRTSVSFLSVDHPGGIRSLLVTSTSAGDGKTLVAANLAAAYAQAGYRTVVISADLRRPGLEQLFMLPLGGPGLADAFALDLGRRPSTNGSGAEAPSPTSEHEATTDTLVATIDRVTCRTRVPNLWVLPAGTPVPNPAELLSSHRMDDILAHLSRRFDMVIVDSTPLLAVTDAAALAAKVGHVLVVASMAATGRRSLARAAELVQATRAEVIGVALNKVTAQTASYRSDGYGQVPADLPPSEVPSFEGRSI